MLVRPRARAVLAIAADVDGHDSRRVGVPWSLIGGSGLAQSVVDVFASGEKSRVITRCDGPNAGDAEEGLERRSRLCF
jgi:hypothetical protein